MTATKKNPFSCDSLAAGPFLAVCKDGQLHSIRWHGLEILRSVSAPIRDQNWGTLPEIEIDRAVTEETETCVFRRRFRLRDVGGEGALTARFDPVGLLEIDWRFTATTPLKVNRAGICVLHPLAGVEDTPLTITRPDRTLEQTTFPALIAAAQPAKNIAALHHEICGVSVSIKFEGEIFEMEDQRNWSDASYKTYCRPLSRPMPFDIAAGECLQQRITVCMEGTPQTATGVDATAMTVRMPEILLAVEPAWLGPIPAGCGLLARFDGRNWTDGELAQLGAAPLDAEFVVPVGAAPGPFLEHWAARFASIKVTPRNVIALPVAYLKSYQPGGLWPDGPTPSDCVVAARAAFPKARIGVGMLTHFTELNRCPPTKDEGDYITHGNAAIVHTADDLSVLQTLEALPAVFRSARQIGGGRPYRLGLVSIAMRSNPYGSCLAPNPLGELRSMTDTDPRQAKEFAATYAITAAALAAMVGAEAICLAAPAGPFSLKGPVTRAINALCAMTGQEARISANSARFSIVAGTTTVLANATLSEWADVSNSPLGPTSWRHVMAESPT